MSAISYLTITKKSLVCLAQNFVCKKISSYYRKTLFAEVLFKSGNFGRLKDIVWYAAHDLSVGGCCYGACLLMAKLYFASGKKVESLAVMQGDTSYQAAHLQKETNGKASLGAEKAGLFGCHQRFPVAKVIANIENMKEGVYCFHFPTHIMGNGYHGLLMIKEKNALYFYDSNFAFGKEKCAKTFIVKLFDWYKATNSQNWVIVQELRSTNFDYKDFNPLQAC